MREMRRTISILTWILIVCSSKVPVHSQYYSPSRPYDHTALKVTKLHFFLHETVVGNNPTAVLVARPNNSSGPFGFGTVYVIDDPLKIGPEHDSKVIGNARGLTVTGDENGTSMVTYLDFGFTDGKFNGSSISIFSRNMITETERELAVVGGRGKFRMAKGFARLKTYMFKDNIVVIDYQVTVIH